jgi:hypothetical protein
MAEYGRALNDCERRLRAYYLAIDELGEAMKGKRVPRQLPDGIVERPRIDARLIRYLKGTAKKQEAAIVRMFLDAVKRHDRDGIIKIAEAVWFLRDKRPAPVAADPVRAMLLRLKRVMALGDMQFTIEQIEQFVMPPRASAFPFKQEWRDRSALRRMCKALGIHPISSRPKRKSKA